MDAGFTTNFDAFNRAMQRKVDELGMAGPLVVKQEAGALARTLINITPPLNRSKTMQKVADKASNTFAQMASENPRTMDAEGGKAGRGDVRWYAFQQNAIFGVGRDVDLRTASDDDIYQTYLKTKLNTQGRMIVGKRGKQTVYIWRKWLTKKAQVTRLIARLRRHVGRLKAGWLVSWRAVDSPSGTLGPVPQWVLNHEQGARGYVVNGLGVKNHPSFTLCNYAVGAGKLDKVVANAMRIRAKAMAQDILLYWKGVKKI